MKTVSKVNPSFWKCFYCGLAFENGQSVSQSASLFGRVSSKTDQKEFVFEWWKQNPSVGEIIFLRFGCDENGYFQKRITIQSKATKNADNNGFKSKRIVLKMFLLRTG